MAREYKKKLITETIDSFYPEGSIHGIIDQLNEFLKNDHGNIRIMHNYDTEFTVIGDRLETDRELERRIKESKRMKKQWKENKKDRLELLRDEIEKLEKEMEV